MRQKILNLDVTWIAVPFFIYLGFFFTEFIALTEFVGLYYVQPLFALLFLFSVWVEADIQHAEMNRFEKIINFLASLFPHTLVMLPLIIYVVEKYFFKEKWFDFA